MLVFFTNLSLEKFQVRYLALLLLFSVIDGSEWFWMRIIHKNIMLMLDFLKAPFLVLHFSYYTLMTFLMLSGILLSMLMILLWQQLELTSEFESDLQATEDSAGGGLLISMLEKLNWFHLTGLITLMLMTRKWMGLFLKKNHLLRCWSWMLRSLPNWIGHLTLSLLLSLPPKKLEP